MSVRLHLVNVVSKVNGENSIINDHVTSNNNQPIMTEIMLNMDLNTNKPFAPFSLQEIFRLRRA